MKDIFYPRKVHSLIDVETNVFAQVSVTSSGTTKSGHLEQPRNVVDSFKGKMHMCKVLKIDRSSTG